MGCDEHCCAPHDDTSHTWIYTQTYFKTQRPIYSHPLHELASSLDLSRTPTSPTAAPGSRIHSGFSSSSHTVTEAAIVDSRNGIRNPSPNWLGCSCNPELSLNCLDPIFSGCPTCWLSTLFGIGPGLNISLPESIILAGRLFCGDPCTSLDWSMVAPAKTTALVPSVSSMFFVWVQLPFVLPGQH